MKTALLALVALALAPWAASTQARPPQGGAYPGGAHVRPVQPIYRAGPPAYRPVYPGYRAAYRPFYPGYRPGWNAGYWGPRGGWAYGGPGYWGAWPYAAAVGFGLGAYAVGYPYVTGPLVVNTVVAPPVYVEQDPAPVAPAPVASYWYYCPQPAGYFPYVKDCSQPWLKVVPQAPGEQATPPQLAR